MSDANPDPIEEVKTPIQDVDVQPDTTPEDDKEAKKDENGNA